MLSTQIRPHWFSVLRTESLGFQINFHNRKSQLACVNEGYFHKQEFILSFGAEKEILCIRTAIKKFGVRLVEDDLSFIEEGDLIESYNLDMAQPYRNFEFFRHCSYDLLTLTCHARPTLYERPQNITKRILERAGGLNATRSVTVAQGIESDQIRHR